MLSAAVLRLLRFLLTPAVSDPYHPRACSYQRLVVLQQRRSELVAEKPLRDRQPEQRENQQKEDEMRAWNGWQGEPASANVSHRHRCESHCGPSVLDARLACPSCSCACVCRPTVLREDGRSPRLAIHLLEHDATSEYDAPKKERNEDATEEGEVERVGENREQAEEEDGKRHLHATRRANEEGTRRQLIMIERTYTAAQLHVRRAVYGVRTDEVCSLSEFIMRGASLLIRLHLRLCIVWLINRLCAATTATFEHRLARGGCITAGTTTTSGEGGHGERGEGEEGRPEAEMTATQSQASPAKMRVSGLHASTMSRLEFPVSAARAEMNWNCVLKSPSLSVRRSCNGVRIRCGIG
jgi:hypothetical protein